MSSALNKKNFFSQISLEFFAGGTAAAISKTCVAPIERLKLFYQVQHVHPTMASNQYYRNIFEYFKRIPKEQGILSFWRGNVANILRYFPLQACNFTFNEQYKRLFGQKYKKSLFIGLLSGGLAGVSSLTVVYPLDFVRTRMAVDNGRAVLDREFKSLSNCFKKVYANSGLVGFYRGYTAGISCYFIYRGCYFGFYEYFVRMFVDNPKDLNFLLRSLIAEVVAISSQSVAYPFDTVRRRMMMQNALGDRIYKNTRTCWIQVYKGEGIRGFYPGLSVNAFRSIGAALVLVLYDEIIDLFTN